MSVSVAPSQVSEGSDATFTISSSVPVSQPIKVKYSMSGKAKKGIDYTLSGISGQITIPAGQSSANVVLHASADHVTENSEPAIMTLTSGAGYKLSTHVKATLTITNGP